MKKNQMSKAWLALALAMAVLLGLELAFDQLPFFAEHFKDTHFMGAPGPEAAKAEEAGEVVLAGAEKPPLTPAPSHTTRLQVRQLFTELQSGKRKRLRIAYFADSMTEGDVVTEVLRRDLQQLYGGRGVGFQAMAPRDASYRVSLIHRPTKDWQRFDLHDLKKDPGIPLFIGGEAYHVGEGSFDAGLRLEEVRGAPSPWYERAVLYWGRGDATLEAGGSVYPLKGNSDLNAFTLPSDPQPRLELKVSAPGDVWFYGVSLESENGVQLDNYTFRGNGGDGLFHIKPEMLQAAQEALHYDLVILHFGINALRHGEKQFRWYRSLMKRSFEHFKANLPGARIMVISVMDHAEKVDGEIVSDSSLPYVLAAQDAAAQDSGLWFFNLYEAMGGAGVMKAWVDAKEPLANRDYTHPNRRGGARLSKYIRAALLGEPMPSEKEEAPHAP